MTRSARARPGRTGWTVPSALSVQSSTITARAAPHSHSSPSECSRPCSSGLPTPTNQKLTSQPASPVQWIPASSRHPASRGTRRGSGGGGASPDDPEGSDVPDGSDGCDEPVSTDSSTPAGRHTPRRRR
ncbi:hypothetical protein DEH18_33165 [Streptomyces sp. NHF165]|nr:hypothetical protein DEH18_33165 [Streptomyces sp. NHF165]